MFEKAHAFTAKWEGGLTKSRIDRGGVTNYGCSIVFLTDFARTRQGKAKLAELAIPLPITEAVIRSLTPGKVKEIFRLYFWDNPGLKQLNPWPDLAVFAYDCGVNHGPRMGIKFVQRAARAEVAGLADDGVIGPKTLAAIAACGPWLASAACDEREKYFKRICARDATQEGNLRGWLNRLNDLRDYIHNL